MIFLTASFSAHLLQSTERIGIFYHDMLQNISYNPSDVASVKEFEKMKLKKIKSVGLLPDASYVFLFGVSCEVKMYRVRYGWNVDADESIDL